MICSACGLRQLHPTMMRPVRAFAAAFALAVLAGCSSNTASAAAATPKALVAPCTTGSGGQLQLTNIYVLPASFDPSAENNYVPPSAVATPLANADIMNSLTLAFNAASQPLKRDLCGLSGIFVTSAGCANGSDGNACIPGTPRTAFGQSWGYREHPPQVMSNFGKYIGISGALWPSGKPANTPILTTYESNLLYSLFNWPTGTNGDPNPPAYTSTDTAHNTSTFSIIAALAHETGHVLWYVNFRPTAGGNFNFAAFCGGTFYFESWRHVDSPPRWRTFGDTQSVPNLFHETDPNRGYTVGNIYTALAQGDYAGAKRGLHNILRHEQHWASPLSVFSPDEDFVETYTLKALAGAGLTSLSLLNDDVIGTYPNKATLNRKLGCFPS